MLLHLSALVLGLANLVVTAASTPVGAGIQLANGTSQSDRFIVQFKDSNTFTASGQDEVSGFITQLESLGITAKVHYRYSSPIFHGVSISVATQTNITEIYSLQDVVNVHPVAIHKAKDVVQNATFDVSTSESTAFSTTEVVNNTRKGYDVHHMTGVDKLHEKGIRGAGVKIGFVESGVDYRHPGLGGCFGPGCKVVGGWDFIGDYATDPSEAVPDSDPLDTCGKVGNMKAGLLFMDDEATGVVGVAPDADIYAYRLSNCMTKMSDDIILAALQRAYEDGVDVIHVVFLDQVAPGWSLNPLAVATSNLVKEGIFVAIGAADVGQYGSFLPPDSTMGDGVAAVGSIDVDEYYASVAYASVEGLTGTRQIAYTEEFGVGVVDWNGDPLVATLPVIEVAGYCTGEIPSTIPADLSKYAVIVKRECDFNTMERALAPYKATNVLVYNALPSQSQAFLARSVYSVLNVVSIDYDNGVYLSEAIKSGKKTTLAFAFNRGVGVPNKNSGGQLSDFTQWGPNFDLSLWPHFVAPGSDIFSTYSVNYGSYTFVGTTGMASAYTAGVAALYYSQHGGRKAMGPGGAKALRDRMVSTAKPVVWQDGSGPDWFVASKREVEVDAAPALVVEDRAVMELEKRAKCNHDNCLRAMIRSSAIAAPFCSTYTTATASMTLPVWATACSGLASRISSGCSCINTPATTTSSTLPTSTSSMITTTTSSVSLTTSSTSSAPTATATGVKAPVAQQGGGLINALGLVEFTTTVSPNSIALNDTANFISTWTLEISNPSSEALSYHLTHDPSVTFYAVDPEYPYKIIYPPALGVLPGLATASLSFKETTFDIPAGSTNSIEVSFILPPGLKPELLPVYSGFIKISSSSSEEFSIPYQGVAANMLLDIPIWSSTLMPSYPSVAVLSGGTIMPGDPKHVFTFVDDDVPYIAGFNLYGTGEMRIDVMYANWTQADWTYPPVPGTGGYIQTILTDQSTELPIINKLRNFNDYLWEYLWIGSFANDPWHISNGDFKIVMSALKPFGDKSKIEDWQIVETGVFGVNDLT